MQKNKIGPLSYTIYKDQLKVHWRLKIWNSKTTEEIMGKSFYFFFLVGG